MDAVVVVVVVVVDRLGGKDLAVLAEPPSSSCFAIEEKGCESSEASSLLWETFLAKQHMLARCDDSSSFAVEETSS